jgi:hypothetical protein
MKLARLNTAAYKTVWNKMAPTTDFHDHADQWILGSVVCKYTEVNILLVFARGVGVLM